MTVDLNAGIAFNSIFVLGNAPRSVRIDAVVASGGQLEGNVALPEHHFHEIPSLSCVENTLNTSSQTSPFKELAQTGVQVYIFFGKKM